MSKENNMILELWELIKEYVHEKQRGEVAVRYLKIMDDYDMSEDFDTLQFEDHWLEDALLDYVDPVEDEDDYMNDEE